MKTTTPSVMLLATAWLLACSSRPLPGVSALARDELSALTGRRFVDAESIFIGGETTVLSLDPVDHGYALVLLGRELHYGTGGLTFSDRPTIRVPIRATGDAHFMIRYITDKDPQCLPGPKSEAFSDWLNRRKR